MAAQPPFALHPADAIPGVIDLTTREGIKLYQNATRSFYSDPSDCFNCEAPGLHGFLKEVEGRASRFGWRDAILEIPNDIDNPLGGTKNLLTHYGELSLDHLHAWESTYLHGISRAAQDTAHLHLCLMNSLTQAGKVKVRLWSDQFILNGRESGILLLKIIIRESHLDTNATTNSIRTQLSNLDEYITTIGCDIIKFNEHVKRLLEQLKARGGETHDLLTNLFKAYTAVKDARFVDYVNEKLSRYEEGEQMEADQLMTLTANKYKNMMIQNQWEAPSPHDATIQALQTKVEKLQRELKRAPKPTQQKSKQPQTKKERQTGKPQRPKWLTNNEKPQSGQLTRTRMWNGNKWYWCSKETGGKCEGRWVRHAPSSCEGKAFKGFKERGTVKEAPKSERIEKKNKKQEEHEDEKGRKYKRLTAAFATTYNESNNSINSSDNDE